jgi:hypothetical protein
MNIASGKFTSGSQKVEARGVKSYKPFLYRAGQRRYACHGRLHFKRATGCQAYAAEWARRVERYIASLPVEERCDVD